MTKILVADDEADLEFLSGKNSGRKSGTEIRICFAHNGQEALQRLAQHPILPSCSAISICRNGRAHPARQTPEAAPSPGRSWSRHGDMDNIRLAMNQGRLFDLCDQTGEFRRPGADDGKNDQLRQPAPRHLQAIKENNILKMYVDPNVLNFMGTREYEIR